MPVDLATIEFPKSPGVYLFKNYKGDVLYVGKATDLKSRVNSYSSKNPDRQMIPKLIFESSNVDYILTNNPSEALLLERQLIREHKPKFNSRLKDDRSYPYIAITNEEIPRIIYTRNPPTDAKIWGPFTDVGGAKKVIQLLRSNFGIRDCSKLLPQGCLSMHIGLCAAPCLDSEGYSDLVNTACNVLDGDAVYVMKKLVDDMNIHSEKMEYELAAKNRDLVRAIQSTLSQKIITSRFYRDCDAIGFASRGEIGVVTILHAKNGIVQGQQTWPLIHRGDLSETIVRFICDYYANRTPPKQIVVPIIVEEMVMKWLSEKRGNKVDIRVPKRGVFATLRKLADQNAEVHISRFQKQSTGSLELRAAEECAKLLGVELLDSIVCFDMAQLRGEYRVGACVHFRSGRPNKSGYRYFEIKTDAIDDIGMMEEVVNRWLMKQKVWPDLLLIDGGKAHLNAINILLKENGLNERILLAALAKKEETLHRISHNPIILDRRGRLLVHARDEAHRHVNNFHRKIRGRRSLRNPLEDIDGLGAKKIQSLMVHFGGNKGIKHATLEQLKSAPGVGKSLASRIYDYFHPR